MNCLWQIHFIKKKKKKKNKKQTSRLPGLYLGFHREAPNGHMTFIQCHINVDAMS